MSIPFIGPRSLYSVLGVQPSLLVHKMASGNLDGTLPKTALLTATELDPVVTGGKALWEDLTGGGLFNFVKKAVIVEALSSGTWEIIEETAPNTYAVTRTTPSTPFRLSPDEKLRISGVASATALVRLDVQKCI